MGALLAVGWAAPGAPPVPVGPGWVASGLDRAEVVDLAARLHDAEGRPARVTSEVPALQRVLGEVLEVSLEGSCTVGATRGDDLRWTLTVGPGSACILEVPGPAARWREIGMVLGPSLGNRGAGGWVAAGPTWWWRHEIGVGGRVWGTAEVVPGVRRAAGVELALTVAAGPAFIRVLPGFAVNQERRTPCSTCPTETRGPLVGPTLGGEVGVRQWRGPKTALDGALRVASVPGRGYLVALTVGVARGRAGRPGDVEPQAARGGPWSPVQ